MVDIALLVTPFYPSRLSTESVNKQQTINSLRILQFVQVNFRLIKTKKNILLQSCSDLKSMSNEDIATEPYSNANISNNCEMIYNFINLIAT